MIFLKNETRKNFLQIRLKQKMLKTVNKIIETFMAMVYNIADSDIQTQSGFGKEGIYV